MAKKKPAATALRDMATEDAIMRIVNDAGGEIDRRRIVRRLSRRSDIAASLGRMERRGEIEVIGSKTQAGRILWRVRSLSEQRRRA